MGLKVLTGMIPAKKKSNMNCRVVICPIEKVHFLLTTFQHKVINNG